MTSYVSIANLAATKIGTAARLTAPSDDTTLGRAVASVWEIERQAALRDGAWNFATRRALLPQLTEPPAHGFEAKFRLPADCLKLIEIYELHQDNWQLEGRDIHADMSGPLKLRYLADIAEPAEFDPLFAKAFALRIAVAIGDRIAGSMFDKIATERELRAELMAARRSDAMENPPIDDHESEWVEARFHGHGSSISYDHALGQRWS